MNQLVTLLDLRTRTALSLRSVADGGSTVADARSQKVDRFAAQVLIYLDRLQRQAITSSEYQTAVRNAFDAALGDVPDSVRAQVEQLKAEVLQRAGAYEAVMMAAPGDPDAPSDAMKQEMANRLAGGLWGATFAVAAAELKKPVVTWHSQEDSRVCPTCKTLDGQSWSIDKVPFWPGQGGFGEFSECGPECRCRLD